MRGQQIIQNLNSFYLFQMNSVMPLLCGPRDSPLASLKQVFPHLRQFPHNSKSLFVLPLTPASGKWVIVVQDIFLQSQRRFKLQTASIYHRENRLPQQIKIRLLGMLYKQTIKLQLKNAVRRFNRGRDCPSKTHTIEKKLNKKKYMRQSYNYYQRLIRDKSSQDCHVLNFYNILAINEQSIRNPNHEESFMKTHFYYKNMKKVEVTENYLIIYLTDHHSLACPVSDFIARYKVDTDPRFRKMAALLEDIERKLQVSKPSSVSSSTLPKEAVELLQRLGKTPYIAKIGSNQLAVSKSLMALFGYDSEEFIIECIKFRVPLFDGFSCKSYYEVVMKNLENVLLLMDLLNGRIPLETFQEQSYFEFVEGIKSKNNVQYNCRMSISMPVPLIAIVKLQEILSSCEKLEENGTMANYKDFKQYYSQIREKEYRTLQHLVKLPINILPVNKPKVADYLEVADEQAKSSYTFGQSK